MYRLLIVAAACLMLPFYASGLAAHYSVSGRVTDAVQRESLAGAHIIIKGTYQGVFADRNGYYELPNVPEGEITLKASFIGYESE